MRAQHSVHVVGHDAPCEQIVTLAREVPEFIDEQASNLRVIQPACTMSSVKEFLDALTKQRIQPLSLGVCQCASSLFRR
jgi:hypothetical protein